jgi:hypothetical protein
MSTLDTDDETVNPKKYAGQTGGSSGGTSTGGSSKLSGSTTRGSGGSQNAGDAETSDNNAGSDLDSDERSVERVERQDRKG